MLRNLYNATINQADSDDAIAALELAIAFPDTGQPHHALSNLLFGHLQRWLRDKQPLDRALALIPRAETWGALWPMILHNAACVCACAGELAAAVRCVDLAKQAGYTNLEGLLDDDDLAPVRTAGLLLAYGR